MVERTSNQFLGIGITAAIVGFIAILVLGITDFDPIPTPQPEPPIDNGTNQTEIFWNVENLTIDINTTDTESINNTN